jgi:prephenate dehydrogenase
LTIAIIGLGLIGTSVKLAVQRTWSDVTIVEIERGDPLEPAYDADIVVLATPVDVIIDILRQHARHFDRAVIIDTGSTKRTIVTAARAAGLANFVGGHPMAGAASSGPREARADMFEDRPWFLVPHGAARAALECAQTFVQSLGAKPVVFEDDGSEHDRVMAAVSHLPQVVASALMVVVGDAAGERGLQWAGTGLRDTTRLAKSSATMWTSILAANARELQPLLQQLADDLRTIAATLDDAAAVERVFTTANRYRARLDDDGGIDT